MNLEELREFLRILKGKRKRKRRRKR